MGEQPILRIHHLSKTYPGVQALRSVSFDVQAGQVHALVGENGAGKSTLIKILAGAEQPDPGSELWLEGTPYAPHNPKDALAAGISTIYQVFNLLPDRSVMHNVLLGKEPNSHGVLNLTTMHQETRRLLDLLGAPHISPDSLVGDLRVGEKQIVEIAKALANRSKLLIMDEPTAALNQTEVNALFNIIRMLRSTGVTILYVSHRLDEIFELADTVTVLRDGEHISTQPIGRVTRDGLIMDMIGRKLEGVFPTRPNRSDEEVLRLEGVSYGGMLKDVHLSLHRGEILAVTGLSGSGKTELGKALFGELAIDSGRIVINGKTFKPSPARAIHNRLIFLPEDRKVDGLLQELSVQRNITLSVLGSRVANRFGILRQAKERAIAQEQVSGLGIRVYALEQPVLTLSGGNQQKVVLGRCLAAEPDVFILMEPTQGIDVGVKFEIYQFIADLAARGKAILLISSELTEILGLAHRILVMRGGRVVAELDSVRTNQEEILRYALGEVENAEQSVALDVAQSS